MLSGCFDFPRLASDRPQSMLMVILAAVRLVHAQEMVRS